MRESIENRKIHQLWCDECCGHPEEEEWPQVWFLCGSGSATHAPRKCGKTNTPDRLLWGEPGGSTEMTGEGSRRRVPGLRVSVAVREVRLAKVLMSGWALGGWKPQFSELHRKELAYRFARCRVRGKGRMTGSESCQHSDPGSRWQSVGPQERALISLVSAGRCGLDSAKYPVLWSKEFEIWKT